MALQEARKGLYRELVDAKLEVSMLRDCFYSSREKVGMGGLCAVGVNRWLTENLTGRQFRARSNFSGGGKGY